MSDQEANLNERSRMEGQAKGQAVLPRKAWSAPLLTVRSIEELTMNTGQEPPVENGFGTLS